MIKSLKARAGTRSEQVIASSPKARLTPRCQGWAQFLRRQYGRNEDITVFKLVLPHRSRRPPLVSLLRAARVPGPHRALVQEEGFRNPCVYCLPRTAAKACPWRRNLIHWLLSFLQFFQHLRNALIPPSAPCESCYILLCCNTSPRAVPCHILLCCNTSPALCAQTLGCLLRTQPL